MPAEEPVVAPTAPAEPAKKPESDSGLDKVKAAAEESAKKAKETYDYVVPAKIDWSKTCWPTPMVNAIHTAQDAIATGVNTAGELASKGVNSVGDVASSATGAVTGAVGGGDQSSRAAPKTPRQHQSWHLPFSTGGDSPEVVQSKSVEEVGQWLDDNGLGRLKPDFAKQKHDGKALSALVIMWRDNKKATMDYCQESLKLAEHDALALGTALHDLHNYTWVIPEPPKTEETSPPTTNKTAPAAADAPASKAPAPAPPAKSAAPAAPETGI